MTKATRRGRITQTRAADEHHVVHTVEGGGKAYRRTPCAQCPWRVDQTGAFPAQAFVLSAPTSYDMADRVFACHMAGAEKPQTCAGFLARNSAHNFAARLMRMTGELADDVSDGGLALHKDYRTMAVANGVDPNHAALTRCRGDDE